MTAIASLKQFSPEKVAKIAQMYFALGFIEMNISEFFCNGTPFGYTDKGQPAVYGPADQQKGFTWRWRASIPGWPLVANVAASDAFGHVDQELVARRQGQNPRRSWGSTRRRRPS